MRALSLTASAIGLESMFEGADNPRQTPKLRYELILPFPPSANHLWRYVGRGKAILHPDYQAWIRTCDGCVLEQLSIPAYRKTIHTRYELTLALDARQWKKVDQGNCEKAVSDTLQRNRLVDNDKFAWKTIILWEEFDSSQHPAPVCRVSVEQI